MRSKQFFSRLQRHAPPALALGVATACALAGCNQERGTAAEEAISKSRQEVFADIDFESDTANQPPSSWTVTPRLYFGYGDTNAGSTAPPPNGIASLDLRTSPNGGFTAVANTLVLAGTTVSQRDADLVAKYANPLQDKFRFPKYGTKSTVVNYNPNQRGNANQIGKNHNANVMSATMTLGPADIDPADGQLHVRFVYAPIVQSGGHMLNQQPFAAVRLTRASDGAILYDDIVAASTKGAPWLATGSGATDPYYFGPMDPADHVAGWKVVDILPGSSNVQLGDRVKLEIFAAGCYATAHWGRVYVDSFGIAIPDLYVVAQGVQAANQDTDVTYTYVYKNGGTGTAVDAFVDFAIPQGTTFKSVDIPGCTVKTFADPRQAAGLPGGPYPNIELYTCPVGNVPPGGGGSFKVVVHVTAGTQGQTDVNGHYSSYASNVDPLVGPDIRTVITTGISYADVASSITSGFAAAASGDPLVYTATVRNKGPNTASNVDVSVGTTNAPLGAWTCAASGGAACPAANGTGPIAATGVSLPNGGALTYTINAVAGTNGTAVARVDATVRAPNSDSDTSNNSAAELLQIGNTRDVKVTKGNLGTVRSAPVAIDCGTNCTTQTRRFLDGSTVILEATPPAGGTFLGWTGDCAGTAATCTLKADGDKNVGALFVGPLATVTATGGTNQTTSITTAFPQPLALKATDSEGTGIPGLDVVFTAPGTGASASLAAATMKTDAQGTAQTVATANAIEGSFDAVATVDGKNVTYALRSIEPPGSITVVSGAPQEKVIGELFDQPLVVEVRDYANAPRKNALVRFAGPTSGATASFTSIAVKTGDDGRATVRPRAGFVAGTYGVRVSVDNAQMPASLTLTNLAAAPASILVEEGSDRQAAKVLTPFARPLRVRVVDAHGNPVPAAGVDFVVPASEPRANVATSAITDTSGAAEVAATAGATPGSYLVSAVVSGTKLKADFALQNLAESPIVVKTVAGTPQTAVVDTTFGAPLKVLVTRDDQPLKDVIVSFAAPATGATSTLSTSSTTTDASGYASVTAKAGTKTGTYQVAAFASAGRAPALFVLENGVGAAVKITPDPLSTPQNMTHGKAFAAPLRAHVTDAFGNPVPGTKVTFAAPAAEPLAILDRNEAVTDAAGQAFVDATAGAVDGAYVVTATAPGASAPATFGLGNLAGGPVFLSATDGSLQRTPVLTAFADPLSITARDDAGQPASGRVVTFTPAAAGPSAVLASATATTAASGEASTTATANATAGARRRRDGSRRCVAGPAHARQPRRRRDVPRDRERLGPANREPRRRLPAEAPRPPDRRQRKWRERRRRHVRSSGDRTVRVALGDLREHRRERRVRGLRHRDA